MQKIYDWLILSTLFYSISIFVGIALSCDVMAATPTYFWHSNLSIPMQFSPDIEGFWGRENVTYKYDSEIATDVMHVFIPKGAYDPGTMMAQKKPVGGAGFKLRLMPIGDNHALLTYRVKFPSDFDFVLGGKLPGLFGGVGNSGGHTPTGSDGFSFRLMWGPNATGSVYAYLPSSIKYGSPLLHKKLSFTPGIWHTVMQELVLNDPGESNGLVRMWIDGRLMGEVNNILIRLTEELKINGIFFDVFFGGNDPSWASSKDTYIEFADFSLRSFVD